MVFSGFDSGFNGVFSVSIAAKVTFGGKIRTYGSICFEGL